MLAPRADGVPHFGPPSGERFNSPPTPALGCPPLGLLGKGRDRGQGRLVEGERGRERERDRPQWNYDALPRPEEKRYFKQRSDKQSVRLKRRTRKAKNKRERKRRNRWTKINRKVNQKSTKNQCKIHRQSINNRPTIDQKSVLEGSRGALGGSWRPRSKKHECDANFWGLLGPSWARLRGLLGPSWRLDRRLGPSWGVLGPSGAVLKSMSKSIKKSMPFKIGFWNDFDEF